MLIGVFKSNQKSVSILVFVLTLLLWLPFFFIDDSRLGAIEHSPFNLSNKTLGFIVSVLLISVQAIYLNYIINEFKLITSRTYLPALFYVLLNSGSSLLLGFNAVVLVNTFVLVMLHLVFSISGKDTVFSLTFNVGFLLAVASMVYFPIIIFLPLFLFALLYLKTPNWREFTIFIIGVSVPTVFYLTYFFWQDSLQELLYIKKDYSVFKVVDLNQTELLYSFFYVVFFVGIAVGLNTAKTVSLHVVRVQKGIFILVLFMVLMFVAKFVFVMDGLSVFVLMIVPLAIFFADFFNGIKRKWLAELLFTCLLVSIVIGYFS